MSVEKKVSMDGKTLTIAIKGRFDFSSHQDFATSMKAFIPSPRWSWWT